MTKHCGLSGKSVTRLYKVSRNGNSLGSIVHQTLSNLDQYIIDPWKEAEMVHTLSDSQPIGRMGQPQEVAFLALYLCSDEASFITGSDYPIDGGFIKLNN
jgi:NAD(P)-dependent dehydrogenase (short-subunit alcohol dehydrogenase family)